MCRRECVKRCGSETGRDKDGGHLLEAGFPEF